MAKQKITRVAQLKSATDFTEHLSAIGTDLPFKEHLSAPGKSSLGQSFQLKSGQIIGNRFCILPMEGWDGTTDGLPTENTKRRWHNFAISGAKLLWGCEAVAVCPDGRANPNQLMINEQNLQAFKDLYADLVSDHEKKFGATSDLLIGLQLTHSGRFAIPDRDRIRKPKTLYRHSLLDKKFNLPEDHKLMTDAEIDQLVDDFVKAASLAKEAGFQFVDVKHCHGYLGHEFLSAKTREGKYGGSLKNRMRFLTSVVEGIRATSNIPVAVRLSAFDFIPYKKNESNIGIPEEVNHAYTEAFGGDTKGTGIDISEVFEMLGYFEDLGIELVCITAGSPYYVPHIQRPAIFPPSDGYLPPEDPLVGVARQIQITDKVKKKFPKLVIVGSAYSYLQEWLPNVAEAVIDENGADFIGLGRMVLSYPEMPDDILKGNQLVRGSICRTFSDCTTAPRIGMISGCFPLDSYYKKMPEAAELKAYKKEARL
ncbi:NADH:flavin oxidoreductase [Maribacter algarum]|uniref:NADH:flavin oxidoreductase n=1 Tax=Maribacter algarum (ex Zhang et al. 2020) TaxID=2578118 RepID=A0A5S3PUG1_9FLAO|nr:NADH:flavin oxidoreductase [Maribacter algarum]TMM58580.1 NADH:flavin oxidoreductase [Maribacter algarum]